MSNYTLELKKGTTTITLMMDGDPEIKINPDGEVVINGKEITMYDLREDEQIGKM